MTCTQQHWDFFKPIAESVEGVKTVNRSGGDKMDRLIEKSNSEDLYPATFLQRPKYSIGDNGAGLSIAWFDTIFYLICSANMSDEADEDQAFDQAEHLATAIYAKLLTHVDEYTVLIDPDTKVFLEPIQMVTLDATYGYEVRFRIGLMVNAAVYETL